MTPKEIIRSYNEYRKRYFPKAVEAERRAKETPRETGERLVREVFGKAAKS